MSNPYRSLQHTEAIARAGLLDVTHYDVSLDLASSEETFASRTTITFTSGEGETFLDLKPVATHAITLDGTSLPVDLLDRGRVPLRLSAGRHELVVEATMRFRNDGEGLHAHVDPADGRRYVYGMSFMDAAPSVFACFDQPDLKAPYTFHVTAPQEWTVIGNAPGEQVEPGVWEFQASQPLSTYFVTLVAGPYHLITDSHDGIKLGLSARQSLARELDRDAEELLTVTKQCFDEFHRLFGIRYPFGDKYHQAFVPEFNAGAMENPGCVTFRDPLLFTGTVPRGLRVQRATTVAHEMAHQWFGNIVTPRWWDDLWLNESFAEYMGSRVTAAVTQFDDAWTHNAWARRQWGLVADQRPSTHPVAGNGAVDATAALQDFDGISYAKGSAILKQLNATIGDDVFLAGAIDHFTTHRFGNATMNDLIGSWERAGAGDLTDFTAAWLRTAGPDTISLDRATGELVRTAPDTVAAGESSPRRHALQVAVITGDDTDGTDVQITDVTLDADRTPFVVPTGAAVVPDPYEATWAAAVVDDTTVTALLPVLAGVNDGRLRSGTWNAIRSAFHQSRLSPAPVVELVASVLPTETDDDAVTTLLPFAASAAALTDAPGPLLASLHTAALNRATTADPGSTLQLSAFLGAVSTTDDVSLLGTWLAGDVPAGVVLDSDVAWAVRVRLAVLGATDVAELDEALAADPSAKARVEYTRARASLPEAEAKAWAWQRFTGEVDVPNYELEAAGLGMWRSGQEELTAEYADAFLDLLPSAASVHAGWVLGTALRSFYPHTALTAEFLSAAEAALDVEGLDLTVRRNLVDATDTLRRRLTTRARFA
ncbi:aminopeptidase N [Nocardioides yefusunii]|uniref:Aminopeptidase N n=1 Tax=Nocardioides yefusunii TaxID=2500546 RepID=A0ABW1QSF4_9ACTN|nr:aminopeptidase N [Nocardioides yefusunii]